MKSKYLLPFIVINFFLSFNFNVIADNFFIQAEVKEAYSGGQGTVFVENKNAYSLPLKNLKAEKRINFFVGNSMFRRAWIPPSELHVAKDGLGPFFNANSCVACHINDGRGHLPNLNLEYDDAISLVIALAIPPQSELHKTQLDSLKLKNIPDPEYGSQLSDFAVDKLDPEGKVRIEYDYFPVMFDNGKIVNLRKPKFSLFKLKYGPLHNENQISARIAQPMIGLGLIENIDPEDILVNADPNDENQDGISGKANKVLDLSLIHI